MVELASNVSNTLFSDKKIIKFEGPSIENFPKIAKNTVTTLNKGLTIENFQLTSDDLDQISLDIKEKVLDKRTIREYLKEVKNEWVKRTGEIKRVLNIID